MQRLVPHLPAIAVCLLLPAAALAESPQCPTGTTLRGDAPPVGYRQWCALPDATQHGPSITWFRSGEKQAEAGFDAGKLQGEFRIWYPNGQLAELGHYAADVREGSFETWGEDGTLLLSQTFVNGKRVGEVKQWYPSGQLMFHEHYVDGLKDGPAIGYFENGQKESEGDFRAGQFHGTWHGWYPDGRKRKIAEYVDGERVSVETFGDEAVAADE